MSLNLNHSCDFLVSEFVVNFHLRRYIKAANVENIITLVNAGADPNFEASTRETPMVGLYKFIPVDPQRPKAPGFNP